MASNDVYSMITDRILADLETGVIPWERPWTGREDGAFSGATGRPYSLLNQMLLRKPGAWFTWPEIQKRGGHVKKGEKASFVVFWKQVAVNDQDPATGETKKKLVMTARVKRLCLVVFSPVILVATGRSPRPGSISISPSTWSGSST